MLTEAHSIGSIEDDVTSEKRARIQGDQDRTRNGGTHIERLPPELLFYLSRFLDLASLIVLCTATCRQLRALFSQFDRELLFLEPAHRLDLDEWRHAARTLERYRLSTQCCAHNKTSAVGCDLWHAMTQLTRDESLIDPDLFQSIIRFLRPVESNARAVRLQPAQTLEAGTSVSPSDAQRQRVGKIRCLHLTGWHGMAGAFLIQQLRSEPSLRGVATIVKTERADSRIWDQTAADDRKSRLVQVAQGLDPIYDRRVAAPNWRHDSGFGVATTSGSDRVVEPNVGGMLGFDKCTITQIIVQVGKRRPRREGQAYLRGEGLQMGYQGYCIDVMTVSQEDNAEAHMQCEATDSVSDRDESSGVERGSDAMQPVAGTDASVSANGSGQANERKRLHIILLGREEVDTDAGDWGQNEDMFERSIVKCNLCKQRIRF